MRFILGLILLQFLTLPTLASDSEESDDSAPAYWDYGIGLGAAHYPHYPAASQFTTLAIPVPTFQYRGKILRADERDGAHLYLFKERKFNIELSGTGTAALSSSDNEARKGMADLPWLIALGPQAVYRPTTNWIFSLGVFQGTSTDFSMTRYQGYVFEGKISREWEGHFHGWQSKSTLTLELQAATKEYQALYYDVTAKDATADRAEYFSRAGFLSEQIGYSQSLKSGRFSIFTGLYLSSFAQSVNRASPLHRADYNVTVAIGLNYVLGESKRPEVPPEETSGVISRIRQRQQLKNFE